MAKDGQIRQEATGGLAEGLTAAAKTPTREEMQAAGQVLQAKEKTLTPAVEQLIEAVSPLASRGISEPHKLAREYALAAAALCKGSTKLVGPSAESVRRLLRIAQAHVEGL